MITAAMQIFLALVLIFAAAAVLDAGIRGWLAYCELRERNPK